MPLMVQLPSTARALALGVLLPSRYTSAESPALVRPRHGATSLASLSHWRSPFRLLVPTSGSTWLVSLESSTHFFVYVYNCSAMRNSCGVDSDPACVCVLCRSANGVQASLGLDACAKVAGVKVCGSELWSELPIGIFKTTFDITGKCKPTPPPPPTFDCDNPPDGKCKTLADGSGKFFSTSMAACLAQPSCKAPGPPPTPPPRHPSTAPPGGVCGKGCCSTSSGSCAPCEVGTYNPNPGAVVCTACPAFSTTNGTGATAPQECLCIANYTGKILQPTDTCSSCPAGRSKPMPGPGPCTPHP